MHRSARLEMIAAALAWAVTPGAAAELLETIPAEEVEAKPPFADLELHGLAKVQGLSADRFGGGSDRRLLLDSANFGIGVPLGGPLTAQITFLYEDGRGGPDHYELDEGYLAWDGRAAGPWVARLGRMYLPFGGFQTFMVADPLTQQLGETRAAGARVAYDPEAGPFGSLYLLKGERAPGGAERPDYGFDLGWRAPLPAGRYEFGVAMLSSLTESRTLADLVGGDPAPRRRVAGATAHATVVSAPWTLLAEYLGAVDRFAPEDLPFSRGGARPATWAVELGYGFPLLGLDSSFALGYQASAEALALALPRSKRMAAFSSVLSPNATATLEYALARDYAQGSTAGAVTGTGRDARAVTLQLLLQF